MKTCVFLSLILLFVSFSCFSNQAQEDSLKNLFRVATTDSAKADILFQLGELSFKDHNKSTQYFKEALRYTSDMSVIGVIDYEIGLNNWQLGHFDEAITIFNRAAEYFEQVKDSILLGKTYNNIAAAHWAMGNINEALNLYHTALNIRRAIDDKLGVAKIMNNIGIIYQDWGLYEDAFDWHNEALEVAFETGNNDVIAYSYSNIGNCFLHKNELDTALENYKTGYRFLLEDESQSRSSSFFQINFGEVYLKMNRPDSALYYFQKAVAEANKIKNQHRIAIANYYVGETYLNMHLPDSAKQYLEKSYALSLDKKYTELMSDNLFAISKIHEKQGNINEAFTYFKRATELKDSLFNAEKILKFTDLQIKYFTEQQKQENLILKQENKIQQITIQKQKMLSLGLIIGGVLILVILIYIARSRTSFKKLSKKLEKSENELKRINDDKDKFFTIIAHDLKSPFNGLLGISELLIADFDNLSTSDIKKMILQLKQSSANVYALLEGLLQWARIQTGRMTYTFEKIDIHLISLKVIELLSDAADKKNIEIIHQIEKETFAKSDEKSIDTVFRNLISNAIKYTNPGGKIIIKAIQKETDIEISVSDNGIGMDESILEKLFVITEKESRLGTAQEKGTGLGLILCKEFVENSKGKIWATQNKPKGTIFTFTLPAVKDYKLQPQ